MKILQRYVFGEFFPPLLMGIGIFTFLLIGSKIVYIVNLMVSQGLDFFFVLKLFLYSLPPILLLTIPMGMLLASLISFGRLSADNEATAIKAGGVSLVKVARPIILFSILISLLLAISYDYFLPYSNHKFLEAVYYIARERPGLELREHAFNDIGGMRLYIDKMEPKTSTLKNLIITEIQPHATKFITAEQGKIVPYGQDKMILQLSNGAIHQLDPSDLSKYQTLHFNRHNLSIKIPDFSHASREKTLEEMRSAELIEEISKYRKGNVNVNPFLIELHRRYSFPFACLAFVLIGAPLGLKAKRKSKSIGFGMSLLLIFAYYLFLVIGETTSLKGMLHPFFGMWIPNFSLAALGIIFLYKEK